MAKCIIILSEKSSGSSALQRLLCATQAVRCLKKTRHFENETLYWTKAASVLGLPQSKLVDSEVPISAQKARTELQELLVENAGPIPLSVEDRVWIFEGWRELCKSHGPVFLEKSPHHLPQKSVLALMHEGMQALEDVEFHFVGLVRHPMDVVFSQFDRWRSRPRDTEAQWRTAYGNLLEFRSTVGHAHFTTVRYEDLTTSLDSLAPVFQFCGLAEAEFPSTLFRSGSLGKWKESSRFGHQLDESTCQLAREFGYSEVELKSTNHPLWPAYRESARRIYQTKQLLKKLLQPIRNPQ